MATARKTAACKTFARKPAGGITKAKVKRVAHLAREARGEATHEEKSRSPAQGAS